MPNNMDRAALTRAVGQALAALVAVACGSPPPAPPPPAPAPPPTIRAECVVAGEAAGDSAAISLAARSPDDSAMVRRQWALPPVRLDCTGKPSPGAAKSWSPDVSGRSWTLVLAESAPDAGEIVARWRDPVAAAALRSAGVRWAIPLDLRRVVVALDKTPTTGPAPLSA